MGQPLSILTLAEDLIRLSGLEPGRDIEIVFTGLPFRGRSCEILFSWNRRACRKQAIRRSSRRGPRSPRTYRRQPSKGWRGPRSAAMPISYAPSSATSFPLSRPLARNPSPQAWPRLSHRSSPQDPPRHGRGLPARQVAEWVGEPQGDRTPDLLIARPPEALHQVGWHQVSVRASPGRCGRRFQRDFAARIARVILAVEDDGTPSLTSYPHSPQHEGGAAVGRWPVSVELEPHAEQREAP